MTTVRKIIDEKSRAEVYTISADETVMRALEEMSKSNVGALLAIEDGKITGIFTERDYARKVVLRGLASKDTRVGDLMTQNILTISPSHSVDDCMNIMTNNHVRHLPVVSGGAIAGIISIGDAVKSVMEQQQATIDQLSGYIAGGMST